jgi:hypothetical protein
MSIMKLYLKLYLDMYLHHENGDLYENVSLDMCPMYVDLS